MKTSSLIIAPIIALLLGPPSNYYSQQELAKIYIQPTGIVQEDEKTLITLQNDLQTSSGEIADSIFGKTGLLSTVNALYNYSPELYAKTEITLDEINAYNSHLHLLLQQLAKTYINAINFNEFLAAHYATQASIPLKNSLQKVSTNKFSVNIDNTITTDLSQPPVPKEIFTIAVITISVAVIGGIHMLFNSGQKEIDNNDIIWVYNRAQIDETRRLENIEEINKFGCQLSSDATPDQMWNGFRQLTYDQRIAITDAIRNKSNKFHYEDELDLWVDQKDQTHKTAVNLINTGAKVEGILTQAALPSGATTLSQELLELTQVTADVTTSYVNDKIPSGSTETDVNIIVISGNQKSLPIPETTTTIDAAKQVLAELKEKGAGGMGGTELDNALNAFGGLYAQNDFDNDPLTLSYPEYTFFSTVHLTQSASQPEIFEGLFQIPEKYTNYFLDFLYTSKDGIIEWYKSYHKSLNAQVAVPQIKEGEDDSECLQCKDNICSVPVQSGGDQPGVCGQGDILLTDNQGTDFCLSHVAVADTGAPKICPSTMNTEELLNSPGKSVTIRSLTGSISAKCGYFLRQDCDGVTAGPNLLGYETISTGSGSTERWWWVYDQFSCTQSYKFSYNMYDNTHQKYVVPSGLNGLQIGYFGEFSDMTPSPCANQIEDVGNFSNNIRHGSGLSFVCDSNDGKRYISSLYNFYLDQYHGLQQVYDNNTHQLTFEASYSYGKRNGLWREFYSDGVTQYTCQYANDLKNGDEWSYYPDGSPWGLTQYNNDLMDGLFKSWDQGNPVPTICDVYSQGNYVGPCP